ncbi:MAG: AAA family ATPase [Candidatus Babeliales bacterium]
MRLLSQASIFIVLLMNCTVLVADAEFDAVDAMDALETSDLNALFQKLPPLKVQVELSTGSLAEGLRAVGDQMNANTDSFFTQFGLSLPKVGPGVEAFGRSLGNAIAPMRNQILKGVAIGMATAVTGALIKRLGEKYIHRYMFEPALVAKRYRQSSLKSFISWLRPSTRKPIDLAEHMVIAEQLKDELNLVIAMTTNIKQYGGQFDNILLYGAPGTGKTLFAQLLAQQCGMDYAIIPAANVSQFLTTGTAVEELNNLFAWAAKSKNGTILFFDEAETFLADRRTLTSAAQNALNSFLAHTGTPSNKIMIIGATNRPEILDEAVRSRFGVTIHFPLPDSSARYNQLVMHIKNTFVVQTGVYVAYDCLKDETYVATLAERMDGWSGRTIQKFVDRIRQQALARGHLTVTPAEIDQMIAQVQQNQSSCNSSFSPCIIA